MALRALDESQTRNAVELYASGLSLTDVGRKLDVGPDAVKGALIRSNVQLRTAGETRHLKTSSGLLRNYQLPDSETEKTIVYLYSRELSCRKIARQLNVGIDTVYGAIHRAGVMRTGSEARQAMLATGYRAFTKNLPDAKIIA